MAQGGSGEDTPHRAAVLLRGVGVIVVGLAVAGGHPHSHRRARCRGGHTTAAQSEAASIGLHAAVGPRPPVGLGAEQHGSANSPTAVERGGRAGLHRQPGIGPRRQQREVVLAQSGQGDIQAIPEHGRVLGRRAPNAKGSKLPRPVVSDIQRCALLQQFGYRAVPKLAQRGRIGLVVPAASGKPLGGHRAHAHFGQLVQPPGRAGRIGRCRG